ncbi:MAG: hypothetical protein ACK4MY_01000 [Brevundimonas sp.]
MTSPDAVSPLVANLGAVFSALAPLLTLIGALGGVWLGGRMQSQQAERIYQKQRDDRLAETKASTDARNEAAKEHRAFVAHRLARVLERYAKDCAMVGSNHNDEESGLTSIPDLNFPNDLEWEAVGALRAAAVRDFQNTIPLVKGFAVGAAGKFGPPLASLEATAHAKVIYSDYAARLGRRAWQQAETLRKEAGLPAFAFVEDGWDYAAFLSED